MLRWSYKTYVSPNGREEVQAEIDRYDDYSLEAFSAAVRHLAICPRDHWDEPHGKKLKGAESLYEIRYKANRCATRAIGFFHPDGVSFVVCIICTHKDKIYKPPDAIKTADTRRKRILNELSQTVPLKVDGENFPPHEE